MTENPQASRLITKNPAYHPCCLRIIVPKLIIKITHIRPARITLIRVKVQKITLQEKGDEPID